MRKRILRFLTTCLFTFIVAALLYFGVFHFFQRASEEEQAQLVNINTLYAGDLDFTKSTPDPINIREQKPAKLKQTAWIPDWGFKKGFASLQASVDYFDSVSPVWYYLNSDGLVQSKRTSGYDQLYPYAKAHNLKLIPTISSFDADEFGKILSDDTKLKAHIDFLISEVEKYDYDGLDLDYEALTLDNQPAYLELIRTLHDYMQKHNKVLTIAVISKWTDDDFFRTLRQTRAAQDWYEIAPLVDEVRIMTYDLTGYISTFPGPIGPIDWLEGNLRYAVSHIPRDKIMLGVNNYGYDGWSDNLVFPQPYLGLYSNPAQAKGQADATTFAEVQKRAKTQVTNYLDEGSKEKVLIYTEKDSKDPTKTKQYAVYYQDAQSAKYRYDLARSYGIAGLAFWRMGDEDVATYPLISQ